jgi:hypothetical protein
MNRPTEKQLNLAMRLGIEEADKQSGSALAGLIQKTCEALNRHLDEQIEATRDIDIVHLVSNYVTLKKCGWQEYAGMCPACSGSVKDDRFHVKPDIWFCRKCYPMDEKKMGHDAIGFARWYNNSSFKEAVNWLTGSSFNATRPRRQTTRQRPQEWKTDVWQRGAQNEVSAAAKRLISARGYEAESARTYLFKRGFYSQEVLEEYMIGQMMVKFWHGQQQYTSNAITLPWMGRDGTIKAIQYRLIDKELPRRYHFKSGGEKTLFGTQTLRPSERPNLLIVEGELNAVAVRQAVEDLGVDVVSFGSQSISMKQKDMLQKVAAFYLGRGRVRIWGDDIEFTYKLAASVLRPVASFTHPDGLDANDMLVNGLLNDQLYSLFRRNNE